MTGRRRRRANPRSSNPGRSSWIHSGHVCLRLAVPTALVNRQTSAPVQNGIGDVLKCHIVSTALKVDVRKLCKEVAVHSKDGHVLKEE